MSSSHYVPKANRNPLLKFPREHSCICGSGDMFKDCCLKYQRRAIPEEWAERIKQVWARLLKGELRIVPPKKAQQLDEEMLNPPKQMPAVPMEVSNGDNAATVPDVPVVSNFEESVLASAAVPDSQPVDGGSGSDNLDQDEGNRSD